MSQVIICVGAGGVGKTSVSSMLGLYHAAQGQRTLVITIDPAQRLLDAFGIKDLGHEPVRVSSASGELYAFMPDLKQEWLDFLKSSLGDSARARAIAANPFYRYMADGLPGAFYSDETGADFESCEGQAGRPVLQG